ncbi:hypothetical protein [Haloferula sp. A504]|uniref:hypothetical protein n=1 Tax=Haloferula sp. A504 TaxID=3373601 RepID=UPI0037BFB25A
MDWNGTYGTCSPGTNSLEFVEAVERRVNFYRAMAGLDANVVMNSGASVVILPSDPANRRPSPATTKATAAQAAAMMFSWADLYTLTPLSHDPPSSQPPYYCWSTTAWNGAKNGNLALGFCGPEAIDAYMRENDPATLSIWSSGVGHRRWILKQGVSDFATGDVPGDGTRRASNVLYVYPASSELVAVTPKFVSWPSAGFFPDALMAKQWSLSHPGADFTSATVSMTDSAGAPVATALVDRETLSLGDPAIVWSVPDSVALTSVDADTTYQVTVSGIELDGATVSHSYSVTVIDPDVIPDGLDLTGTPTPPLSGANYFFEPVVGADSHAVVVSVGEAATWTAGAEDGDGVEITDETSAAYALRNGSGFKRSGSKAFRLVFESPTDVSPQSFVIERELLPGSGGQLLYHLRRGYMTNFMNLEVQVSEALGPWTTVDSISGNPVTWRGLLINDPEFVQRVVPLEEGKLVRVRFRLRYTGNFGPTDYATYVSTSSQAGVFIDDIAFSDCQWTVAESEIVPGEGEDFVRVGPAGLDPSPGAGDTIGLRLKATIGGRGYTTPTPMAVTFVAGMGDFGEWIAAEFPLVTDGFDGDHDGDGLSNGLEYAFGLSPTDRSRLPQVLALNGQTLQLSTPLPQMRSDVVYEMQVSDDLVGWDAAGVSVHHSGGQLIGSATAPAGKGFARWKVTQP